MTTCLKDNGNFRCCVQDNHPNTGKPFTCVKVTGTHTAWRRTSPKGTRWTVTHGWKLLNWSTAEYILLWQKGKIPLYLCHHDVPVYQSCPVPVVITSLGRMRAIGKCHCWEADYSLYCDSPGHDVLNQSFWSTKHNAMWAYYWQMRSSHQEEKGKRRGGPLVSLLEGE